MVCGFCFTDDGKRVVLIQKAKPTWQKGLLNGVGGKQELNETPQQAMAREFMEECGVQTFMSEWRHFARLINREVEIDFFTMFSSAIAMGVTTQEVEPVDLFSADRLAGVVGNLNYLIPLALNTHSNHGGTSLLLPVTFYEAP